MIYSPIADLGPTLLQAPTGRQYVVVDGLPWPQDAISILEGADPAASAGDVMLCDSATTPGEFAITLFQDGTYALGESDDGSEQTFDANIWYRGTATWGTEQTFTIEASAVTVAGDITESRDTASGAASVTWPAITADGAVVEAPDIVAGSVSVDFDGITASGAIVEQADSVSGSATVEWPAITASGTVVESRDTASGEAAIAWPAIEVSGAATEGRDTASGSVVLGDGVLLSGNIAERPDTASGEASLSWPNITASGAVAERGDTAAGEIIVPLEAISVAGAVNEHPDSVSGFLPGQEFIVIARRGGRHRNIQTARRIPNVQGNR